IGPSYARRCAWRGSAREARREPHRHGSFGHAEGCLPEIDTPGPVRRRAPCRTACRHVPVDRLLQARPGFGWGGGNVIPVEWDEVVALALGRLEPPRGTSAPGPIPGIRADSRAVGAGDLFIALNTGVAHMEEARA